MSKRSGDRIHWLGIVALHFLWWGWIPTVILATVIEDNTIRCEIKTVAPPVVNRDDPNLTVGLVNKVQGTNGSVRVCSKQNGKIIHTKTQITAATPTYMYTGTKPETPAILPKYRAPTVQGGAICRDGTRSYSTGRGTCSWHGGVAEWL